jgi:hypothetical protein
MAALVHLDKENGTAHHEEHLPAWHKFVRGKESLTLKNATALFDQKLAHLENIRNRVLKPSSA